MLFAGVAGIFAILAILAMPMLVAAPKVLFGRSLSAIAPSLFPYVTLSLIAVLSAGLIMVAFITLKKSSHLTAQQAAAEIENDSGWTKTVIFFVLLTSYGLLLKPVGFLMSSFLIICATSIMLGNRNWLQIFLLAALAPICLYLIATRAMLVSLPELNQVELFYARGIDWVTQKVRP